jgi:hypothetical protein
MKGFSIKVLYDEFRSWASERTGHPAILLLATPGMSYDKQRKIIPALELKCPEEGA